ncbi:arylamine N-acetyltransferase family protein [Amycolatopsis minnesotensis]|uniref:N-hydroxyarylamine O-acetyltransferase n=1 Tax=Amycolatopsis minnesotensis TaxID=337894 RepID=A0ABN2QW52_9PSEU
MFDTAVYLRRLGCAGPPAPGLDTLVRLHRNHLLRIPYDNSRFPEHGGALPDNLADLDQDATFDKIVVRGIGGICFELSLLFQRLLDELGFETMAVSAGVCQDRGQFSPELSHKFVVVRLDGRHWLADVGFSGPSYLEPLCLSPEEQPQYGCVFKVDSQDGRHTVLRRSRTTGWRPVYRFALVARKPAEWDGFTEAFEQYLDESVLASTTMLCRAVGNGHHMLVGKRYLVVEDGHEKLSALTDPAEYERVARHIRRPPDGE